AEYVCVWLVVMAARFGDTATVTLVGCCETVMVAELEREASRTDVAVSVTVAGVGTAAGAVYVVGGPEALEEVESDPQVAPLQPVPARVQVTPLFCESLVTVAVKFCVRPTVAFADVGATATETAAVIVIVAALVLVLSAMEVAVSATVAGLGTLAGAL